ncbi:MAG: sensor histidine kinase [Nodosilinea sp.]
MQQFLTLSHLFNAQPSPCEAGAEAAYGRPGSALDLVRDRSGAEPGLLPQAHRQAEHEWLGGLAALIKLLLELPTDLGLEGVGPEGVGPEGVGSEGVGPGIAGPKALRDDARSPLLGGVLGGPFPVLPDRLMGQRLSHWLLVPEPLEQILSVTRPLLPGRGKGEVKGPAGDLQMVPLTGHDPLAGERFCLLLTRRFSLLLVLGHAANGLPQFQFSFDPEVVQQGGRQLRDRVAATRPPLLPALDRLLAQFPPVVPDYRLVTRYSHLLLAQLRQYPYGEADTEVPQTSIRMPPLALPARPTLAAFQTDPNPHLQPPVERAAVTQPDPTTAREASPDTELLKAMAHEIRTPLTTIRTVTRSLLKRKDIGDEVTKRLRMIDRECTQQIDRFSLIFRAVELETDRVTRPRSPLSAISLNQLFDGAIPSWQQQASRRNLNLTVNVPPCLPMVNSDPAMLTQVLTGLIDRFTHSLPPHSHIKLTVTLAGHQLKLQFQSQPPEGSHTQAQPEHEPVLSPFKALGQLLMFQPETGGLSLNLNATKNLFQALGGKLIVRQRPQVGEVLTVFLPLEAKTI